MKQIETWRKSHSISVENQQTIGVKFRMIIFSTIMGSVSVTLAMCLGYVRNFAWQQFPSFPETIIAF
jgi:hypothetical protein